MRSFEDRPVAEAARKPRWPVLGGAGGMVIAALAGWVTLRAGATWPIIAQDQIVGLAYLLAGTIGSYRRPDNLVGPLLLAVGYSWYIPDFQSSSAPSVASMAYANRRLVNVVSAYLLLAFPTGRLESRWARVSMVINLIFIVVDHPARLLLVDRIPADLQHVDRVAAPGCDCANPFLIADAPALLASIEATFRNLAAANSLLILGIIIHRLATATAPMRRVLVPVVLAAMVGLAVFAFNLIFDRLGSGQAVPEPFRWVLTLARAAVPIGFLVGLLRMKMDKAAVADLVVQMQGQRTLGSLQEQISHALRDPAVRLGYWSPAAAAYVDGAGTTFDLAAKGSNRSMTFVNSGEARLGVIVHDAILDDDRDLLDAVSAAFAIVVDRERLATSVHAQAADALQLPAGPVTFLYADIEGSTALLASLGERYADILSEERRIIRAIVREGGGAEIDSRADEFFGVFPQSGDPIGAALAIHRRLRDRAWPDGVAVKVRIGLHAGEPQRTDEGYVGLDVHRASRVGSAGHGAQTLLSQAARDRLDASLPDDVTVRCLGVFRLKGLPESDPIWQLEVPDLPHEFPPLRMR